MKTLSKNTIKCDRCEKDLNPKKEKSYCFHNDEMDLTTYICAPCVAEVYNEYVKEVVIPLKEIDEGQN